MKTMKSLTLLTSLCVYLFVPAIAQGVLVLTVDTSNPAAVVFTSTGLNSATTETAQINFGVVLIDFLPTAPGPQQLTGATGNLRPSGTGSNATFINGAQNYGAYLTFNDLTLLRTHVGDPDWAVTSGLPAFSGSAVLDLSAVGFGALPDPGASGNVFMRDLSGAKGTAVGTWSVVGVPEPGVPLLLAAGAIVLGLGSRMRRARS